MSETFAHQALGTQVIWNRHLLSELGFAQTKATVADTDNEGVKNQSTKAINHAGAKHYRIAQAMVRQLNVDEVIKTRLVGTEANYADMLTKALPTSPPQGQTDGTPDSARMQCGYSKLRA